MICNPPLPKIFFRTILCFQIKNMLCIAGNNAIYAQATDGILWLKFKNGDDLAFAALYHRYFDVMVKACLHISHDIEIIKDCIHDLFIDLWISSSRLAIPVSVKAYLVRSVQRKMIRQQKKIRKYNCVNSEEALRTCNTVASVEEKMIVEQLRMEQKEHFRKAIGMLTRRQQEAVHLKFYDRLSYPEIAVKMCISTDAIYNLISKAVFNIRESFSKTDFSTL